MHINQQYKSFKNLFVSACGNAVLSKNKKFIIDIDTKDLNLLHSIKDFIILECKPYSISTIRYTVPTIQGYHFITNPFEVETLVKNFDVTVHKNNPTLIYYNNKDGII